MVKRTKVKDIPVTKMYHNISDKLQQAVWTFVMQIIRVVKSCFVDFKMSYQISSSSRFVPVASVTSPLALSLSLSLGLHISSCCSRN